MQLSINISEEITKSRYSIDELYHSFLGVTPYASILSSLLAQHRNHICHGASFGSQKHLIKLDFIWINRSIDKFAWFLKLLASFEQEEEFWNNIKDNTANHHHGRFLDIHLYFTDIKQDANIGSVPLDLITRVYEQACHEDVFTRLKAKTYMGRPNWTELFKRILLKSDTKKDVDVYYCGPKSMGDAVKFECMKNRVKFHREQF
jgi:hypothetical protein